jgi:hypothetical protein
MAKHLITETTDTSFTYRRDQEQIAAEAALDGIYVIRTSVTQSALGPATRSPQATRKDASKQTPGKLPVRKYGDLLTHLATLDRQAITFADQKISKLTEPTPVQRRAFELLGAPIPLTLK